MKFIHLLKLESAKLFVAIDSPNFRVVCISWTSIVNRVQTGKIHETYLKSDEHNKPRSETTKGLTTDKTVNPILREIYWIGTSSRRIFKECVVTPSFSCFVAWTMLTTNSSRVIKRCRNMSTRVNNSGYSPFEFASPNYQDTQYQIRRAPCLDLKRSPHLKSRRYSEIINFYTFK